MRWGPLIGVAAVGIGGLALAACTRPQPPREPDHQDDRDPFGDRPGSGTGPADGGEPSGGGDTGSASGLPPAVEDDRRAAISLLNRSPIGHRILEFARQNGTVIEYLPHNRFVAETGVDDEVYGVEDGNHVWIPFSTLRSPRDAALTLAHELTHAYQDRFNVFGDAPDRHPREAPWAPPPLLPLATLPAGVKPRELEGLEMEAQAFIVEARVARELGQLRYDFTDNWVVRRDLSIMTMEDAVRRLNRPDAYGDWYERDPADRPGLAHPGRQKVI